VEALQSRNGDKDDNRLLAVADFDLMTQVSVRAPGLGDTASLDRFPSCSASCGCH